MISMARNLCLSILLASSTFAAADGMISGSVKDSNGAALKGAFVRARNTRSKITVNVLSDKQGNYRVSNLSPGEYELRATAVGYKNDPPHSVSLAARQSASLDFTLQNGIVRWSDLSIYQGSKLLPEGKGRELFLGECVSCHGFQSRMAATRRDEAGWAAAVNSMRETERYMLGLKITDQNVGDLVSYLNSVFGVDSDLPRSPAELPQYKELVRPFSDEAMKIVYVEYELPGPDRFPWSGAPDKDGKIWMPYFGRANKVGRLDPNTGEVQEFPVPSQGTVGIHSAVPAPDGTVWFSEHGLNGIGRLDPSTRAIKDYRSAYIPGKEGFVEGGAKHTVRVDPKGYVWATGTPLSRLDPRTGKFTDFPEVPRRAYGIDIDKEGNVWFAEYVQNGKIGKVDAKTGKITKWSPPTPDARPRRLQIGDDGIVWFGEYQAGKIGRFDPKAETFQEFPLPGPAPTPYALGIDKNNRVWYAASHMDVIGCLDPKTGQVVEYPFPYPEITMRELFRDSQGRMWFATAANNKVGYFTLASGSE